MRPSIKYMFRVGEKFITNEGYEVTIIEYFNSTNIVIQYEDGYISSGISYGHLKLGEVKRPIDYLNTVYMSKEGYLFIIIKKYKEDKFKILFENGCIVDNVKSSSIKLRNIRNPFHPSMFGVGYLGRGKYSSNTSSKGIIYYEIWRGIIRRCYNEKERNKTPTYKDVTVCEEWHNFQNFAEWYEANYNTETMQGWHLDKDILIKGNKIYSPETCCFVPPKINYLFTKNEVRKTLLPIGVKKAGNIFSSRIRLNNLEVYLGSFKTPFEAFQVYKTAKESYIKEMADEWKDKLNPKVYEAMYNYQVEITV